MNNSPNMPNSKDFTEWGSVLVPTPLRQSPKKVKPLETFRPPHLNLGSIRPRSTSLPPVSPVPPVLKYCTDPKCDKCLSPVRPVPVRPVPVQNNRVIYPFWGKPQNPPVPQSYKPQLTLDPVEKCSIVKCSQCNKMWKFTH